MEEIDNTIKISTLKDTNELIKNIELKNFIQFKLGKEEFELKDLDNIEEIILDSRDIVGNYNRVYFEEVKLFKNLNKISIRNLGLTSEIIEKISNIKTVEFINCQLKNIKKLNTSTSLILNNTEIDNFEDIVYLSNLEELQLINTEINNFEFLSSFKNLKKLVIKNVKNFSLSKIGFSLPIEYLSIENIESIDLNVFSKYKNIKTVSVDRIEADDWKKELNELKEKNVRILLNDMYEY